MHDDPVKMVAALFLLYSAVTMYQYKAEADRKCSRLAESVYASPNRRMMREAFNRGARAWLNQAQQYVDMSVDVARVEAFRDAGVDMVKWVSQKDGRVCTECSERDGMIFHINNVPDKPHPRCRCYIVPVNRGDSPSQ